MLTQAHDTKNRTWLASLCAQSRNLINLSRTTDQWCRCIQCVQRAVHKEDSILVGTLGILSILSFDIQVSPIIAVVY